MTSQQFLDWMDAASCKTALSVGETLGIGREVARKMVDSAKNGRDVDVKLSVRLAMSAVAMRLPPWGEQLN